MRQSWIAIGSALSLAGGAARGAPAVEVVTFPDGHVKHHACAVAGSAQKHFFFMGLQRADSDGAPKSYHPGFHCDPEDGVGWKGKMFDCGHLVKQATCARHSGCSWKGKVCHGKTPGQCTHSPNGDKEALDYLANAGAPGNFYGLAKDAKSHKHNGDEHAPCVQGPGDPAPGFYVSASALVGRGKGECDPRKYVDSSSINYVALPATVISKLHGAKGDIVAVGNWATGKVAFAIFADAGGKPNGMGEGSVALARALGSSANPKGSKGADAHAAYLVFLGSAPKLGLHPITEWPPTQARIDAEGRKLLDAWGGEAQFRALSEKLPRDNPAKPSSHPCGTP
jgi:hypothetical protein